MISPGATVIVMITTLFAAAHGSVDEFQCTCGYNARRHVRSVRTMLAKSGEEVWDERTTTAYGPLVKRMLLVAHSRPEPTARWLWLLNLYANEERPPAGPTVADALNHVSSHLDDYLKICSSREIGMAGKRWSQDSFEKYVLENVTSAIEQQRSRNVPSEVRDVQDFGPCGLYLNDVAANGTEDLVKMLMPDIGVDWMTTADELSRIYRLSKANWVSGTGTLVLYQKKFLSTVSASVMSYVLIHVMHCQKYWLSDVKFDALDGGDNGNVSEYDRIWMSVGNLLHKFKLYFGLSSEKYFRTLSYIAANPARSDDEFLQVKCQIETAIVDVGDGLFGIEWTNGVRDHYVDGAIAAVREKDESLIQFIALVDSNISAAEKYVTTVQELLVNVNFNVIKDFMSSTHIWLI